jgi:hypothetical protein
MSFRFKLQTAGFMEDVRGLYGEETDYICWILRVSYDEADGLLFERGYAHRWFGNHIKLGELDGEECQFRLLKKLPPGDPQLDAFVQWIRDAGVLGWDLCADVKSEADSWHVWRFRLELDGRTMESALGIAGAPLPSFDAFKGFKFQESINDTKFAGGVFKDPPEPVDILGPSAWPSPDWNSGRYFLPAKSHSFFCQGDPRMVELTRRAFDLLESRSLPPVISYRDTEGRALSVDFARRSVKVTNRHQSIEVKISEKTLNAFWKSLDGREYGEPAKSPGHWPNWPANLRADYVRTETDFESAQDSPPKTFLWHTELCDGHDRWAGNGHSEYWSYYHHPKDSLLKKFNYFNQLLDIEDLP